MSTSIDRRTAHHIRAVLGRRDALITRIVDHPGPLELAACSALLQHESQWMLIERDLEGTITRASLGTYRLGAP